MVYEYDPVGLLFNLLATIAVIAFRIVFVNILSIPPLINLHFTNVNISRNVTNVWG